METLNLGSKDFKMPGYTGYVPGLQETFGRTPVMAQVEVKAPEPDSFIYTREMVPPASFPPASDPTVKQREPDVLWPALLTSATQGSLKPPPHKTPLGDHRIDPFTTTYSTTFKAPFKGQDRLRSPNRNEDLETVNTLSLRDIYASAYNRVGEARLKKIIETMRERLTAKMGNQNNNAFKFRKLFQMFDKANTGHVHVEDFRNMAEQFGMQLDDDSLFALFKVYDPEGTGYLEYHNFTKHLMDADCFALYANDLDVSADHAAEEVMMSQVAQLQKKFAPRSGDLDQVLQALDPDNTGMLSVADLRAGCASLGLVLGDKDLTALSNYAVAGDKAGGVVLDDHGHIHYGNFITLIKSGPQALTKRTRTTRRETDGVRTGPPSLAIPTHMAAPSLASPTTPTSPAAKRAHK